MNTFFKDSILYVSFLILMLFVIDFLLIEGQKNYPSKNGIKLKKVIEEKSLDSEIVIFGSSVAEGGIDPLTITKATGLSCINLALSGRRIQDWQPLAYNYLEQARKTKFVIIDIFPNAFNYPNKIYYPHEYYPYLSNPHVKGSLTDINEEFAKMSRTPFYYLTQLNSTMVFNAARYWYWVIFKDSISYQLPSKEFNKIESTFTLQNFAPMEVVLDKRSITAFKNLLEYCHKKKFQVILAGMPVFTEGRSFYKNPEKVYFTAAELAAQFEYVEFCNFFNDSTFNSRKEYFFNYTHLNYTGAQIISEQLATYILSLDPNKNLLSAYIDE